jgi:Ca-activated chloride channel family protein
VAALAALILAALAEWVHARRVRRVARLAFGPGGRPAPWARAAPYVRVASLGALAWALATLLVIEPRRYESGEPTSTREGNPQHVLLVLDVSPSMRLVDAGPEKKQSRMQRARLIMESFFDRVPLEQFRVSVVAFYNGAKSVVTDTKDFEVVRNILGELPMHFAFPSGKTKLFDGLEEAARVAKNWNPRSATVIVLSDGDTVPGTGMPKMPASVRSVLVVGVGDPETGKFIDGKQSRQDVPALKQIAARLGGVFHNGNDKQLPSSLIADATGLDEEDVFEKLGRREYALIVLAAGALLLGLLPVLLHFFGTSWRPGASSLPADPDHRAERVGAQVPAARALEARGPQSIGGRNRLGDRGNRESPAGVG